jgi:hypothetical protein
MTKRYETPVLFDLAKVTAGCGICITGGGKVALD